MPPPRPARASAALLASLAANAALAGGVAYLQFGRPAAPPAGGPAAGGAVAGAVSALGRVQPAGGVVGVGGLPGDRVTAVNVALGAAVNAGDVLLTLAGDEDRRLGLATLDAQLREAEAVKAATAAALAAKLKELDAEVAQARAKLAADLAALDAKAQVVRLQQKQAGDQLARLGAARTGGVTVSPQEFDAARSLAAQADAEAAAVGVQQAKAAEQQAAAEAAAAQKRLAAQAEADRALAAVPVASLRAGRDAAAQKLRAAEVRSPVKGRVVKLAARPGDTLTAAPAVQVADTSAMAVLAEVYETDLPRLKGWLAGGAAVSAEVTARAAGDAALTGTTTAAQVAPMIARNQVFALGPREDADRRVVEVEVTLDAASAARVADLTGLQVTVTFPPPAGK